MAPDSLHAASRPEHQQCAARLRSDIASRLPCIHLQGPRRAQLLVLGTAAGRSATIVSPASAAASPPVQPAKRKVGRPALGWKEIIHRTAKRAKTATSFTPQNRSDRAAEVAAGRQQQPGSAPNPLASHRQPGPGAGTHTAAVSSGGRAPDVHTSTICRVIRQATCSAQMPFTAPIKTQPRSGPKGHTGVETAAVRPSPRTPSQSASACAEARALQTGPGSDDWECAHALIQLRRAGSCTASAKGLLS